MPRLTDRLDALERIGCTNTPRPLPVAMPDTATNAELDELRRLSVDAYRQSDPSFLDLFVESEGLPHDRTDSTPP